MRLMLAGVILMMSVAADSTDGPKFTGAGDLVRPTDYREWVYLSSGLGMSYGPIAESMRNANPPFDNVFVNRSAYREFQQSGKWKDGTIFVLEIRSSASKASINQGGQFQAGLMAIEAEVKSNGKWTFYGFSGEGQTGKPLPRTARCYSCHAENGAVDNTFVQFYPTLLDVARANGTMKEIK